MLDFEYCCPTCGGVYVLEADIDKSLLEFTCDDCGTQCILYIETNVNYITKKIIKPT